jgi:hypothetical protein
MRKVLIAFLVFLKFIGATAQIKNTKVAEIENTGCKTTIAFNPRNPKNIAVAAGNTVFYSIDGGTAWQKTSTAFKNGNNAVLISDSKGGLYYFLQANENETHRIISYTSDDGGVTWSDGIPVNAESTKDQVGPNAIIDDKNNIYLTYAQFDKYSSAEASCLSYIQLSKSSNGKKWNSTLELSQTPGNCIDDRNTTMGAMTTIGADGKEYCAWSNQSKIFLDRSFNGKLWLSNDIAIVRQSEGCDEKTQGGKRCYSAPVLSTDRSKSPYRGSLYLAWSDWLHQESDVLFVRSHNFGDNWTSLLAINDNAGIGHQYSPWLTVDQVTGYVYIVYFGKDEDDKTDVYLAYSIDGGSSFKNVKISEAPFTTTNLAAATCYISANKGTITSVWTRTEGDKASVITAVLTHEDMEKIK